jgi:hypothetical protein
MFFERIKVRFWNRLRQRAPLNSWMPPPRLEELMGQVLQSPEYTELSTADFRIGGFKNGLILSPWNYAASLAEILLCFEAVWQACEVLAANMSVSLHVYSASKYMPRGQHHRGSNQNWVFDSIDEYRMWLDSPDGRAVGRSRLVLWRFDVSPDVPASIR